MYIEMHIIHILIMEANTMSPDQTALKGAVWSGSIVFAIEAFNVYKQLSGKKCCEWSEKGWKLLNLAEDHFPILKLSV